MSLCRHFRGVGLLGSNLALASWALGAAGCSAAPDAEPDTAAQAAERAPAHADSGRPCTNTPTGLPFVQGDTVVCRVQRTLDKTTAPELREKTGGAIERIDLDADIALAVKPAVGIGGVRSTLELDPQVVKGKVHWKWNGRSSLKISIAPKVTISGNGVCDVRLESVDLGVQSIETGMPSAFDRLLVGYVRSRVGSVEAQAREAMEKALLPIRSQSCDLTPATPVGEPYEPDARLEAVRRKVDDYLAWGRPLLDAHGWMSDTHCDGLLMNSLYSVAGGPADIPLASYGDGRWDRHWMKDCYPNGSRSTISRDMMAGLSQWLLSNPRLDLVNQIVDYGEQHSFQGFPLIWIMGQGEVGRADQPPAFVAKMYMLREKLGGRPSPYPNLDPGVFGECESYECHLSALDVLFRARLGPLTRSAQEHMKYLADSRPRNALFNLIYGRYAQSRAHFERGLDVLLDPTLFPSDRLPTNHDRCNDYIFSREPLRSDGSPSDNWTPCPSEPLKTFSGTDFLFAAAVALGRL